MIYLKFQTGDLKTCVYTKIWEKQLTQYSLSKTSKLQVGILESVFHLLIQRLLFALDHDGGATVQDPLWGSFHHQQVLGLCFSCEILVNGKLGDAHKGKYNMSV